MHEVNDWTPLDGLYRWEREQPDAIYLTQPVGDEVYSYTWAEVADQVRRMAMHLQSCNFPPGSRVALLSKNCAHWFMANLAIWMAGHVCVPIYPSIREDAVRHILTHSDASFLFLGPLDTWDAIRGGIPAQLPIVTFPGAQKRQECERACLWNDVVISTPQMPSQSSVRDGRLAAIFYTSGTTGLPKGVMLSFTSYAVSATLLNQIMPFGPSDRMLSYLPIAHAFEAAVVFTASLRYGFHVYFNESLDTFSKDLQRARPTIFHSVPRLWVKFQLSVLQKLSSSELNAMLQAPDTTESTRHQILKQLGLHETRLAITGSAPLAPAVLQWYRALGLELLEGYGMTEDFAYSHFSRPGRTRVGYVGEPMAGVDRRIADSGEVQIKSPARLMGYYKDEGKNREAFTEDGFFKTGDLGEIDDNGRLRITGRVKELFKTSKGKYVAPAPIENKFHHSKVEAVCVTGPNLPQPIGLVMLSADARQALIAPSDFAVLEFELQALLARVNADLDPHEKLQFIVIVRGQWTIANGFLTATMKIKRDTIEQHYAPCFDAWSKLNRTLVWEENNSFTL